MKKFLSLLIALTLLFTLAALPVLADEAADAGATETETAAETAEDTVETVSDEDGDAIDKTATTVDETEVASDVTTEEEAESWSDVAFEAFGKTKWYVYVILVVLVVLGIVGISRFGGRKGSGHRMSTRVMSEGAMMIALATVLSMVKVWVMPLGGSVTLLSMLPIILMSFRHGTKWGVFTAFVHSLLQLILGLKNLGYCATLPAQIACILLDYVFAFTVLGLAFAFASPFKNRTVGVCAGTAIVCLLRFVCHFLSGIYLWGSYKEYYEWAANMPTWLYSLLYNGNYMLPELIITVIGAVILVRGAKQLFDHQAA